MTKVSGGGLSYVNSLTNRLHVDCISRMPKTVEGVIDRWGCQSPGNVPKTCEGAKDWGGDKDLRGCQRPLGVPKS